MLCKQLNGRYYSQQGETLGKGFARYPLQRQARVSSPLIRIVVIR